MNVDSVYRHIYYRVGYEAEDLTQHVFLEAWETIRRYMRTESRFIAWLMTMSHSVVVNFSRTRYKQDKAYLEADIMAGESIQSPEQETTASFEQQLRRAILQLSRDQQHVIVLRFVEAFRSPEVAPIIGKIEGAIKVILHRGLLVLRHIVEEENGNAEEV